MHFSNVKPTPEVAPSQLKDIRHSIRDVILIHENHVQENNCQSQQEKQYAE
jgi:hypothetical protein